MVRAGAAARRYIPLEFADAAYRYGHGQIRHTYRLVDGGPAVPLFPDLVGFGPLPADRRLDLTQIFDVPGRPPAQRAKRLDGRLAASLIGLPEQVTGAVDTAAYRSLAVRDLLRGETTGLPSGEAVARLLGVTPLTADELEQTWPDGTPLWFYILKEAEHRGGGDRLGPVGGRIVAEVLIGLLRADPASYLSLNRTGNPTCPPPDRPSAWPTCSYPRSNGHRPAHPSVVIGAGQSARRVGQVEPAMRLHVRHEGRGGGDPRRGLHELDQLRAADLGHVVTGGGQCGLERQDGFLQGFHVRLDFSRSRVHKLLVHRGRLVEVGLPRVGAPTGQQTGQPGSL